MKVYFFDSRSIVKHYVQERDSSWVISVASAATNNLIYRAHITGVEVVSAITRRARSYSLSPSDPAILLSDFRYDFANQYRIIEITSALIASAMVLAETHALRGYDAIQLVAALEVNAIYRALGVPTLTMVSADTELNTAALAEGLIVEDPNAYP